MLTKEIDGKINLISMYFSSNLILFTTNEKKNKIFFYDDSKSKVVLEIELKEFSDIYYWKIKKEKIFMMTNCGVFYLPFPKSLTQIVKSVLVEKNSSNLIK